jgi:fructokinase
VRIGIDLGGTKIVAIALDGSDEVVRLRTDTPRGDYVKTLDAIANLVAAVEHFVQQRIPLARRSSESEGGNPESRIPVGIGIPGTISASTGLVKNANSTWLIEQPLREDLEARLGRPVRIANDANCFAISEATDGAAAGAPVVFGVIVGTGVGGGLVVNGQIVSGVNGIAGEWGHNPLPSPDAHDEPLPACYCGKRGCIETFLSGPGMSADHEKATGVSAPPPEIVEAAARGDAAADATLQRYEQRMARALAGIINVLDPDVIVLGGGMSNIGRLYTNVPGLWRESVFCAGADQLRTRLVPARHGDASGVRGAAWLWPASP